MFSILPQLETKYKKDYSSNYGSHARKQSFQSEQPYSNVR